MNKETPKERASRLEFHMRMGFTIINDNDSKVTKDDFKKALKDLYYWQTCDSTGFFSILFVLIAKADAKNIKKLNLAFPAHTLAYTIWYYSENPDILFEKWGVENAD